MDHLSFGWKGFVPGMQSRRAGLEVPPMPKGIGRPGPSTLRSFSRPGPLTLRSFRRPNRLRLECAGLFSLFGLFSLYDLFSLSLP